LPDVLTRWQQRQGTELARDNTDQCFCLPKGDMVGND
jgi:type I restriction enzyme M protein